MMERARAAAERLAALASGLCQDAHVLLEVREVGSWAWDPLRRVIIVPAKDLESKGRAYCAGILAHEVGHYFTCRYPYLAELEVASPEIWTLMNAIEDPRSEVWIRGRYPGSEAWLQEVAAEQLGDLSPLPRFLQFCLRCAAEEADGWRTCEASGSLPSEVKAALASTRDARRAYVERAPDVDLDPGSELGALRERYRAEVWPRLLPSLQRHLPDSREQTVRLSAVGAFDLAWREIVPAALELLQLDQEQVARYLEARPDQCDRARQAVREGSTRAALELFEQSRANPGSGPATETCKQLAEQTLRVIIQGLGARHEGGGCSSLEGLHGRSPLMVDGESPAVLPPAAPRVAAAPAPSVERRLEVQRTPTSYEAALEELGSQVDDLTRRMEDILRPRRRLGSKTGYPSGSRVSLTRLMEFEADPRRYSELWSRKTLPDRRDAAILMLVDLSGSMLGGKDHAALLGTIMLAETLSRLAVPFAVYGFQDELIPFIELGDPLDQAARSALGTMPAEVSGNRQGGHNCPLYNDDGPCLLEAAEHLLERREADRVLIAISDGLPEGRTSSVEDLRLAIDGLTRPPREIQLIGVGLGPDTAHVQALYPQSRADVPVEQFAETIAGLLEEVLVGGSQEVSGRRSSG